jgi:hypothetical protein
MRDRDASSSEMPGFLPPSRPRRELGEPLLDAILEGRSLPPDAPEELCAVAEMLADLAGPAEPGELAGEAAARLGLARAGSPAGISPVAHRSARRRRSWISVPGGARLGAALIAAAVGLGGAAAAYAGALPGPIQNIAHHMFGAPPSHDADLHGPSPGPDRSGPGARPAPRPGKAAKGHGKAKAHGKSKAKGKAKGHAKAKPAKSPPGKAKGHAKAKPAKSPPGKAKGHAKAKPAKAPPGQANARATAKPATSPPGLAKGHGTAKPQ